MKKNRDLLLSILSGLIFAGAWPTYGFAPLLFFAFIPLLWIERKLTQYTEHGSWLMMRYSFLAFFIFNVATTWWVGNVAFIAGVLACVLNTILMTVLFQIYHFVRVAAFDKRGGEWLLAPFWICFEKLHYTWELNWPWLNLGNAFANTTPIIQWYEYTGILGGTLWVILINYLLFIILCHVIEDGKKDKILRYGIITLFTIIAPIFISLVMYSSYKETSNPIEVVVYQPNSDPFGEQFELSDEEIIQRLSDRTKGIVDEQTNFILCPESMMQNQVMEQNLDHSYYVNSLRKYLEKESPQAAIIVGASTYRTYHEGEEIPPSARKMSHSESYYDAFNTTLYIDTTSHIQKYHKSKLTPGVEIMPYIRYMPFLNNLALDLGGTVGTLGIDKEQKPFTSCNNNAKPASVICYESIFGEHVTRTIKNDADVIFISTNDGWWKDTEGHRQHCAYARLLAIETRRDIARSANTGISCSINQRGDISNMTKYWTADVFKTTLNLNSYKTFYVRYGDYISHIAIVLMIVTTMAAIINRIVIKKVQD